MISPAEQRFHRRELAIHEAAHCAAFLAAGVMPKRIHVNVNDREANGAVVIGHDELSGVPALIAVLAGILAMGEPAPSWPPLRGRTSDETQIADLVEQLAVKREGYRAVVRATYRVIASKEHMAIENAFAYVLENCTRVIDQRGIQEILDTVASHHYDEEEDEQ